MILPSLVAIALRCQGGSMSSIAFVAPFSAAPFSKPPFRLAQWNRFFPDMLLGLMFWGVVPQSIVPAPVDVADPHIENLARSHTGQPLNLYHSTRFSLTIGMSLAFAAHLC